MALILCLETATAVCSVALFRNELLLGMKESSIRNVHSSMLTVFIEAVTKESGTSLTELDSIAISMGPGSFTGLRIGVATAKGLCYALDKPLIAVSTLQAMAVGMNYKLQMTNDGLTGPMQNATISCPILVCPMIDARRMEVYCALYNDQGQQVEDVRAEIIDEGSFGDFLAQNRIVFGGEGAEKCKEHLKSHPNAMFLDDFSTSAQYMNSLAAAKFKNQDFENLAYFEPFYLKDYVAGKPRVKGLH